VRVVWVSDREFVCRHAADDELDVGVFSIPAVLLQRHTRVNISCPGNQTTLVVGRGQCEVRNKYINKHVVKGKFVYVSVATHILIIKLYNALCLCMKLNMAKCERYILSKLRILLANMKSTVLANK